MLRERVRAFMDGLEREPTTILCGVSIVLVVSHYRGSAGAFRHHFPGLLADHPAQAVMGHFYWFGMAVLLYLVVPLILSAATRGSFHDAYGMGLGDWRLGLTVSGLFLLVMIPAVYVAARWLPGFQGMYPLAGNAAYTLVEGGTSRTSLGLFVAYEAGYVAYFVAWEFLFRGWMVHGLVKHWGKSGAILAQVAPFAVMHFGKAELEALGSVVAGVALGLLSLRTRSFWYGALIHGAVAVAMDVISVRGKL